MTVTKRSWICAALAGSCCLLSISSRKMASLEIYPHHNGPVLIRALHIGYDLQFGTNVLGQYLH